MYIKWQVQGVNLFPHILKTNAQILVQSYFQMWKKVLMSIFSKCLNYKMIFSYQHAFIHCLFQALAVLALHIYVRKYLEISISFLRKGPAETVSTRKLLLAQLNTKINGVFIDKYFDWKQHTWTNNAKNNATYSFIAETVNSFGPQPEFPRGNVYLWCNFREGHPNTEWCEFIIDGSRHWKTRKVATGKQLELVYYLTMYYRGDRVWLVLNFWGKGWFNYENFEHV